LRDLERLLRRGRRVRVVGFDDGPFDACGKAAVHLAGVVCEDTRFEGMVWGEVTRDGFDATDVIESMLSGSKFLPQLHLLLLDGIAVGGFNVVDITALSDRLALPCIAVMRRMPDLERVRSAMAGLAGFPARLQTLQRAGPIHELAGFHFQVSGADAGTAARLLERLTDRGRVPEALRIAHLIGAAVERGVSGHRA